MVANDLIGGAGNFNKKAKDKDGDKKKLVKTGTFRSLKGIM